MVLLILQVVSSKMGASSSWLACHDLLLEPLQAALVVGGAILSSKEETDMHSRSMSPGMSKILSQYERDNMKTKQNCKIKGVSVGARIVVAEVGRNFARIEMSVNDLLYRSKIDRGLKVAGRIDQVVWSQGASRWGTHGRKLQGRVRAKSQVTGTEIPCSQAERHSF